MTIMIRPAQRESTLLIVGLAGPTKSGKTKSAHRLAAGMANGGTVVMLNAEGPRGHQYADQFKYLACDISPPYSPARYTEHVLEIQKLKPAVLIIDSASHMHDGPGGLLEMHTAELDRMAGTTDYKKRDRMNWAAWVMPKATENKFIYTMLDLRCHIILCFRAKEKLKIIPGKDPIDLGWQPIASDRVSFETMFTLMLPPHCKGVPDLATSDMREPFDTMIPTGKPLDEALGVKLAEWSKGSTVSTPAGSSTTPTSSSPPAGAAVINAEEVMDLGAALAKCAAGVEANFLKKAGIERLDQLPAADFAQALEWIARRQRK